jgi:hypothetical protein
MKFAEFRQDTVAQRKFLIFGGVVVTGIAVVMLPSPFSSHKDAPPTQAIAGRTAPGRTLKPPPAVLPAPVVTATAPVIAGGNPATPAPLPDVALPPADTLAKLTGKWSGSVYLRNRGNCQIGLTIEFSGDGKSGQPYRAGSDLSCAPTFFEILGDASKNAGKKVNPAEEMAKLGTLSSPTSATLAGVSQDGAIVLKAVENVGVVLNPNNCEMLSMTLRDVPGGKMSVKWQETERGNCHGGEMEMTRLPGR